MATLEEKIEELKKEHASLELKQYRDRLYAKYEELKKLEGTVQVRIQKSSKTMRWVHVLHHVSYVLAKDEWKRPTEPEHEYIAVTTRGVTIMENKSGLYPSWEIKTHDVKPKGYEGKIHAKPESNSYDFSTHKTISVDEFNAIYELSKVSVRNILDGLLDIKDVRWVMNGTDQDKEYKETDIIDAKGRKILDVPYYLCENTEEGWMLNKNRKCAVFLNKNIYLITPNSLKALDEWLEEERRWDNFSSRACASVGERWRGSRIDQYQTLVNKIKSQK